MTLGFSCGDNSDSAVRFGMGYHDDHIIEQSDSQISRLTIITVIQNGLASASKDSRAIPEIHAMLAQIGSAFGFIPFELHEHCNYICIYSKQPGKCRGKFINEPPKNQTLNGLDGIDKR